MAKARIHQQFSAKAPWVTSKELPLDLADNKED